MESRYTVVTSCRLSIKQGNCEKLQDVFINGLSESKYTVNLVVRESVGALRCLELVGALSCPGRVGGCSQLPGESRWVLSVARGESVGALRCLGELVDALSCSGRVGRCSQLSRDSR